MSSVIVVYYFAASYSFANQALSISRR